VTLGYTYDGSLLTGTTSSGLVAGSVTRTYATDFRVATESVNGANPITFQYDPDSLLTQAGSLSLTRNTQNGLLTWTTLGNVTDGLTYSTFGELSTYQASYSGSPQLNVQYTRDSLGRITQKVETIGGVTATTVYGYDTAGRLTDVTVDGSQVAHYEYDGNGNRLSVIRPGTGTVSGSYDAQDRLTTYGAVSYTYSANGDLQSTTSGGQTTTYNYDVFGNLTAATLPTGTQIEYVIDGRNRRIGKRVNGTLVQAFLYGGHLSPVAELDGTGATVSRFVYGTKLNVPDYMIKGSVTYRIVTDHLGSPRLIIDTATGAVAQRLDYDEFGQMTFNTAPGFQPFGFAGGLYDPDTKLTRFGARDYDAFAGRWTAKDPIRFGGGGTNLYGYALDDPINLRDPMGLSALGRLVKAYRVSRGGERELVKEVYSRSSQELVNEVKRIADKATEGSHIAVVAQSEGKAKALAEALSPNSRARGPEGRAPYPVHYNPRGGPYSNVHVEWGLAILAPNTLWLMNNPCTTMGELLSAGLWDIAGAIDPIFLTDAIDWYFGIGR